VTRAVLLAIILASTLSGAIPSARATATNVVAGPGAYLTTWTTPVLVASRGDAPKLIDADLAFHGLESVATGSDDAAWCGPSNPGPESDVNPRRYARGVCPLFWADTVPPQRGETPVLGLDGVIAGQTYAFRCSVFPAMRGLLLVR